MESQEDSQPPAANTGSRAVPLATASITAQQPQVLPRVPPRTERLPSVGRAQLTPFMPLVSKVPLVASLNIVLISQCLAIFNSSTL